jgi:hypothetical protein
MEETFTDCIATCASQDFMQNRNDISVRFTTNGGGAGGICECLGGLPANGAQKLIPGASYWLAMIQ